MFLSICHLGHLIEQHFGNGSALGCRIEYLRETKFLGTGGCLSLLPQIPEHPLVVMNGDLVTNADIGQLLLFHENGHYSATVGMREYRHTVPFGVLEVCDDRVVSITEKPTFTVMANAGIYVLNPDLVARIPKDQELTMPDILKDTLRRQERVGAFTIDGDWMDIGQVDHLRQAQGRELCQ
jgi:NDP-sugar pyrophosphorylase family protein